MSFDASTHTAPSLLAADELLDLCVAIRTSRRVVLVCGAGVSTSSGIDDFTNPRGLVRRLGGKYMFDESVYRYPERRETWQRYLRHALAQISTARPSPFHRWAASLADAGRLLRNLTQNIDGLEEKLPQLEVAVPLTRTRSGRWPNTVQLHGSLRHLQCSFCSFVTSAPPDAFSQDDFSLCPRCLEASESRQRMGKRRTTPGELRPRVLLYNHESGGLEPDTLYQLVEEDLEAGPDALVVAGTALAVPGAARLVTELAKAVRSRENGLTVWVNRKPPPKRYIHLFDRLFLGACDDFAVLVG